MNTVLNQIHKLKSRLGPLWWHSGLMFVVSRIGNLIDFYIGMFIVVDVIPRDKLGAVLPLAFLSVLVSVPLAAVLTVAMKYLNIFKEAGEIGKVKSLLRDLVIISVLLTFCIVIYAWASRDFLYKRLKIEDPIILWLVIGLGLVACWRPVFRTIAQGLQKFYRIVCSSVVASVVRLIVVLLLIRHYGLAGYLAGTLAAGLAVIALFATGIRGYVGNNVKAASYREHLPNMLYYMIPIGILTATFAFQSAMEPWIIRQRLSAGDSAGYYTAAMFGYIPMYFANAIVPFLFPIVSQKFEKGESTRRIHKQALAITFGVGFSLSILLFFIGGFLLSLRSSWANYASYAPFIWQIGIIYTSHVVAQCHFSHENACRRFRYLYYYVPIVLLEIFMLYSLMGWPVYKSVLPEDAWNWVNGFIRRDLQFIMSFVLIARVTIIAAIMVDVAATKDKAESIF